MQSLRQMYVLYLTLDNTMSYNTVIANKKEDTYEIIKKNSIITYCYCISDKSYSLWKLK